MFWSTSCGQARPPCCCSASFDPMERMEPLCCSTALQPGRGPEPFSLPSNCLPRWGSPSLRGEPLASGPVPLQFSTTAAGSTVPLPVLTRSRRTCRRTPLILPGLHVEEVSWLSLMTSSSVQLLVSGGQGHHSGHFLSRGRSQS